LKSLNEQYNDTSRLSEAQTSLQNKTIMDQEALEKRVANEKEAVVKVCQWR
jgi:hypothetical protein